MINVETTWNLSNMQPSTERDDHKLRKNIAANERYIVRKTGSKFQNPVFNILCKIAFWNKQMCLNKIICFNFLGN